MFGAGTTSILSMLSKGYVTRLYLSPDGTKMTAETISLFARTRKHEWEVWDIRPPDSLMPYTTFEAKGKSFYVEGHAFGDTELWRSLFPFAVKEDEAKQKRNADSNNSNSDA